MKCRLYLFSLFFVIIALPTVAKDIKYKTVEGKWKVVDWTYISYVAQSLDEEAREQMERDFGDLIINFGLNQILSTNKPLVFKFLENKKYIFNDYNQIELTDALYSFTLINNRTYLILHNIALEIEKIKDYNGSKFQLKDLPVKPSIEKKITNLKMELPRKIYENNELDKPLEFRFNEGDEDEGCVDYCFEYYFKNNITFFIDYSKLEPDTIHYVRVVVDKSGDISHVKVYSRRNEHGEPITKERFPIKTNENTGFQELLNNQEFATIKSSIITGIMELDGRFIPVKVDNKPVNAQIIFSVRLISK